MSKVSNSELFIIISVSFVVLATNMNYVSDIFGLWHDDIQTYFIAQQNLPIERSPTSSRHFIFDNLLAQLSANASPFLSRSAVVVFGAVPLFVLAHFTLRYCFGLGLYASAFGAAAPLIIPGQWEVFVGINLSYVVFDAACFFSLILIIKFCHDISTSAAYIFACFAVYFLTIEGMVTPIIYIPSILFYIYILHGARWGRASILGLTVILSGFWGTLTHPGVGRANFEFERLGDVLGEIAAPLNFLLSTHYIIALAVLCCIGAVAAISLLLGRRKGALHYLGAIGFAVTLYVGSTLIFSLGHSTHFPNRYGFIPIFGLFILLAIGVDATVRWATKDGGSFSRNLNPEALKDLGLAGVVVLVGLSSLGYWKANYENPSVQEMSAATANIWRYFRNIYADPISASVRVDENEQLLVVYDGSLRFLSGYRVRSLGYLRFVTGGRNVVGYIDQYGSCAAPLAPYGPQFARGASGFREDAPFRIVGIGGRYGAGAELKYFLSAEGSGRVPDSALASWVLYEAVPDGAGVVASGEGRGELMSELAELELTTRDVAFNCGADSR